MPDDKPKRRWRFRFSLLALLLVMTAAAIVLASIDWNHRKPALGLFFNQIDMCLVMGILPDSTAGEAGVRTGDRIVALNNVTVVDVRDLQAKVLKLKIGDLSH